MNRSVLQIWLLILCLCSPLKGEDLTLLAERDNEAALADREKNYPNSEDWPYVYYPTLGNEVNGERDDLRTAIKFMVANTSLVEALEDTVLPDVPNTNLLRMDIRLLGWDIKDWQHVLTSRYSYHSGIPLVPRADWLLLELADAHASDSYLRLLFGGERIPQTRDEFLDRLGVFNKNKFGLIEGKSGVSVQGVRLIENRPVLRGHCWGTSDVLSLESKKDPLHHPTGNFPFDGQEWIIGIPKIWGPTGDRGVLQVYFLNNKDGKIVGRAPVDLVKDSTHFRGLEEIRFPGGCIQCHSTGTNPFTSNEIRRLIDNGIGVATEKIADKQIRSFHLSNLKKEVWRNQDDYQTMIESFLLMKSEDASAAFRRAVDKYEKPLDLTASAEELGVPADFWADAVLSVSGSPDVGPRLPDLIKGGTIPRRQWEEYWLYSINLINSLRESR